MTIRTILITTRISNITADAAPRERIRPLKKRNNYTCTIEATPRDIIRPRRKCDTYTLSKEKYGLLPSNEEEEEWKQLTGVLCNKKVPIKLKDKAYKTVIKPTMTYGAECWAVRKKDENRLHVAEMRMLRWIRGKTRKDHVRNKTIQEDAKVCQMTTFLRQKRLHCQ